MQYQMIEEENRSFMLLKSSLKKTNFLDSMSDLYEEFGRGKDGYGWQMFTPDHSPNPTTAATGFLQKRITSLLIKNENRCLMEVYMEP